MARWIKALVHAHGGSQQAKGADGSCPVCDHPYAHLSHACIGSAAA